MPTYLDTLMESCWVTIYVVINLFVIKRALDLVEALSPFFSC